MFNWFWIAFWWMLAAGWQLKWVILGGLVIFALYKAAREGKQR